MKRQHDYLVGLDSDGCVFDSMELKHKECFIPNTIRCFHLQGVSKYAREAAEFVNLYSKSRGANRFPALLETLQWLQRRPEVLARHVRVTIPAGWQSWVHEEKQLSNPTLEAKIAATRDPDLIRLLEWSHAVNDSIRQMVHRVPPFPFVRECLQKLMPVADRLVVSATPQEALDSEWHEHGLSGMVTAICGQEQGTKQQLLANAGHYPADHVLMVGDAPGDYAAAQVNSCLFFPINPGQEESSWRRLHDEGIDRFLTGRFAGSYQRELLHDFNRLLPDRPPWPVADPLMPPEPATASPLRRASPMTPS